jgi:iron complex outermembrane recepter protein
MKTLYLTLALLSIVNQLIAQDGTISGRVTTQGGIPAAYASVSLLGTRHGVNTDENGSFKIVGIPYDEYTLSVSLVGYQTISQAIKVGVDGADLEFELLPTITQLQSVEIFGRRESSYKSDYSFSATKTQTALIDIPQTVSTVTKELIQDQQSYRLKDVVKTVSGINQFSVYDDITIRGFRNSSSNGRLLNGLRTYNNFWQSPLLVNIERVEVIKGPASAMFSNTNPGGTINMVTKKPLSERRIGLNFTTGSWNTYRATADFTGPMTKDEKVLYRVNLGYENAESFRDYTPSKTFVIAPSISFVPSENTQVNIDMVYTQNNGVLDRGRPVRQGELDIFATPINLTLTQPGDQLNINDVSLTVSLNQKLTDNISFNTSYMKFQHDQVLQEHRISRYIRPDSIELIYVDRLVKTYYDNVSNYFVGNFTTGAIKHQLLVGYDYIYNEYEFIEQNARGAAGGLQNFSLNNPQNYLRPTSTYALQPSASNGKNYYSTHGVYLQEQLTIGKFKALLGLRQEFYITPGKDDALSDFGRGDEQSSLLPRLGLTYSILNNVNVYGTYTVGYEPQDAASNLNVNSGGPFDPLTGELYELGAKGEFLNKRLFAGISIYEIQQNNILVSANDPSNPELLTQRGQERARGIEVETMGNLLPNLSVSATYAFNDAIITESDSEGLVGLVKENAPRHNSSSWIKYNFEKGRLKGFGVALGHSHNSERRTFATYPDNPDRYLMLPSYIVFNGALFYNYDKFRLALNVNNITGEDWFAGGYNFERSFPGAPRNFLLSFGYQF